MFAEHPGWTSSKATKATTTDVLPRILIAICTTKQTACHWGASYFCVECNSRKQPKMTH